MLVKSRKVKNKNKFSNSKSVWRVQGSPKNWAAIQEAFEDYLSNRLQPNHNNKV